MSILIRSLMIYVTKLKGWMMTMEKKSIVRINGGTMYITHQEDGWIKYFVRYDDGAVWEWEEKEEK